MPGTNAMKIPRSVIFVFHSITTGLAAAFIVILLRPDLLHTDPEVRIQQSTGAPVASYADAVEKAAPSVVNIYTAKVVTSRTGVLLKDSLLQRLFGDRLSVPRQRLETSLGSGVIISPDGYILTNSHVVEDAEQIQAALYDGRTVQANLVGSDPDTDLAVLHIDLEDIPEITIGDSSPLRVGDVVMAIGNPFGVGQTVTMGIVSATGRSHLGISTFEDFIQTDAAINPGNSGGALVNSQGKLVGINSAIYSRSGGSHGIGFAIPVDLANGVLEHIIRYGYVIRGWIGVQLKEVAQENEASPAGQEPGGVIVTGIVRNGPAEQADMRAGDIILRVNGVQVGDSRSLLEMVTTTEPGTRIEISLLRQGELVTIEPMVAQRPRTLDQ